MASTSVKVFSNAMANAPVLSGIAGAHNSVLRACLLDGFGLKSVASLGVAAGVATATFSAGHSFAPGSVALIAGATPAGLNGQKTVITVTAGAITFAAPGVPDGAATGSMTAKLAPAGWAELHPGTANVLALRPSVPEATDCVLRMDDTGTTTSRLVGYEALADINTGFGAYPTQTQLAGGFFWPKSDAASAAARPWRLFADEQAFLLWVAPYGANPGNGVLFGWGDFIPHKSGDAYSSFLCGGANSGVVNSGSPIAGCLGYGNGTGAGDLYVPRAYTGVGGAQVARKASAYHASANYSGISGYSNQAVPYPNSADNSLRISRLDLLIGSTGFRGVIPGVFHVPQALGESFLTGDTVGGTGEFAGKTLMALRCNSPTGASQNAGCVFVDITGPWR